MVTVPTVEHYFQAMKFSKFPAIMEHIEIFDLQSNALTLQGHLFQCYYIRKDWHSKLPKYQDDPEDEYLHTVQNFDTTKDQVMYSAVFKKIFYL